MAEVAPLPPVDLQGVDQRSPERVTELYQEVADEEKEKLQEFKKHLVENGAMTFSRLKPKDRYKGYLRETLSYDEQFILDPFYIQLRRGGMAPPLLAEEMLNQQAQIMAQYEQAAMEAQAMGMPAPMQPKLPPVPRMWVYLLPNDLNPDNPYDEWFLEWHAKDYRDLKARAEKGEWADV